MAGGKETAGPDEAVRGGLDTVQKALEAVRSHLDMDVAFVSQFVGDKRFFRNVDTKSRHKAPIKAGSSIPLDEGYCKKVIEGRLPELIPDTALVPEAMAIPATRALPIGSHLSVPLRLADGRVYGTFCCFSFDVDTSLNERDLHMMRAFAELVALQLNSEMDSARKRDETLKRIQEALLSRAPSIVYQPVFRLEDVMPMGAEALARFKIEPARSPDKWFADAGEVGLKTQLEMRALDNALLGYGTLWSEADLYLGLNSSPQTILAGGLPKLFERFRPDRIFLEITEHDHVEDYDALNEALIPLRARGVQIAIDDAGSGYASMRHILNLRPDAIKLDISLTHGIDADPMKRALARALITFGKEIECSVIAEGVETDAEVQMLRSLGVDTAQGYRLSKPIEIEAFRALLETRGVLPPARGVSGGMRRRRRA